MTRTFDGVFGQRPDLYEPYRAFADLFWQRRLVDPVALDLCRLRVAQLLGCESEQAVRHRVAVDAGLTEEHVRLLPTWPTAIGFTGAQRAALAFAEQFVIDPNGVDQAMRDELEQHYSLPEVVALTEALAVFDGFTRFRLLLTDDVAEPVVVDVVPAGPAVTELPEGSDEAISTSILAEQPEALVAFLRLYGTLWSHGRLDHPIKEMARLRNARVTGCGYCRNVRFAVAREQGLTEDRVALIDDDFEGADLTDREKTVIRYTDTFLRAPRELTDDLRAELAEYFDVGEVIELTVGIALFMGFSKIAVSLGQAPADMPTMIVATPDWPPVPA